MAHHINEMKRKHEHAVRVQEIQSQLEDYEGEDLTRLGELVLEVCTLIKITTSCSIRQFSPGTPVSSLKKKPPVGMETLDTHFLLTVYILYKRTKFHSHIFMV
jgi:hypothetical protein